MNPSNIHGDLFAAQEALARRVRARRIPGVLSIAIGSKIVDGRVAGPMSLHVVVRRKKPRRNVSSGSLLPRRLDGIPVDVLDSEGEIDQDIGHLPAMLQTGDQATQVAYGAAIISSAGAGMDGTIGAFGTAQDRSIPIGLTAAHLAPPGADLFLNTASRPLVARCAYTMEAIDATTLYGSGTPLDGASILVDAAVLQLAREISVRPGFDIGRPLQLLEPTAMRAFIAASLKGNRPLNVFAGAMITRTWQHGTVSSFYPRLADGRYAFCLAQQASAPVPGESGSVYLIWHGQDAFVFGMLYGKRIEPSSRYAILTDLPACLPHLGIEALA